MNRRGVPFLLPLAVAGCALVLGSVQALAGWSGPISEPWWSFPEGGAVGTTGGVYRLSGAVGQSEAAPLTGGVYRLSGGFWTLPAGGAPTAVTGPAVPVAFTMSSLAPNPFSASTVVEFALPARDHVSAEVFDVRGERVKTIANEVRDAGTYRETWDGRNDGGHAVGAGVYFVRVRSGGADATRRVVRVN